LLELKIHADQNSKFKVVKQLFKSRLYSLIKQVFNPKTKKAQFLHVNLLDKYTISVNTVTVNTTSDITHNNLHQHSNDTKIKQDNSEILDKWEISKAIDRAKKLGYTRIMVLAIKRMW
jgi:phosphoribosyl-dephospho-CoA transferase